MWVGVVGSWGRGRHVSGVRVRSTEEEPRVAVSHGSGARGAPRETGLSVAGSRKVCVRVCVGGEWGDGVSPAAAGVLGVGSGGASHLRSRLGNEANLGGQTANNLRLSVVRVGVRVETRRSFSRTFPTQLAHLAPYCQSRSSSVSRGSTPQPSHRCASKPAFFLNRGPRLGSVTLRFPNRREEAKM